MISFYLRSGGRLRPPLQTSVSASLASSLRRWVFNPALNPPPPAGPTLKQQTSEEHRPHLAREQFSQIIGGVYDGLFTPRQPRHSLTIGPPEEIWKNKSPKALVPAPLPNRFAGRSVPVTAHNISQAWGKLHAILKQNKIRAELRLTERHEKKGVKRRRLRSERWRRRFADEVRKKVQLVTEIRLRDRMWGAGKH